MWRAKKFAIIGNFCGGTWMNSDTILQEFWSEES